MAVGAALSVDVQRELGSLALSCVRVESPMLLLRAAQWHAALTKVGVIVPFWVVHDLGLLCVADPRVAPIGPRPGVGSLRLSAPASDALLGWSAALGELAQSEVIERARAWRLSDELVAVLLLRVLGPIAESLGPRGVPSVLLPLDPEVYTDLDRHLPQLFLQFPRTRDLELLMQLSRERLRVITAFEQIDLDTLRLLGMFGDEAGASSSLGMLDVLGVLSSPEANDVVNFSLDLLPSVLETTRAGGQQAFSVDGYAGIERRGSLDSMVLSELAYDEDLFARRFVENELSYYAREKRHEEERRLHYLVVDASASMRGRRSVFARGLALTLVKKLALRGEDVYFRFFDARLYDTMVSRAGQRGGAGIRVPYVLSFRGERGRNYAKVFAQLETELARLARREKRSVVLYILTHAECHVPLETVERLRRTARLYGVFLLPSQGELDLDYLSKLDTVQVVDEEALVDRDARAKRALAIVEDVAPRKS